jgi:hypothetical protein
MMVCFNLASQIFINNSMWTLYFYYCSLCLYESGCIIGTGSEEKKGILAWCVWDCSTNSNVEQLYKKNWSLWSTSLGALITTPFFLEQSAWKWNLLAEKRGAELKNLKRSSPKHPFNICPLHATTRLSQGLPVYQGLPLGLTSSGNSHLSLGNLMRSQLWKNIL